MAAVSAGADARWRSTTPFSFSLSFCHACCCFTCASADVAEDLVAGTWCRACLVRSLPAAALAAFAIAGLRFLSSLGGALAFAAAASGLTLLLAYARWRDRRALAQRDGVRDGCCCRARLPYCATATLVPCAMVCMLAQEVEHTGGAKLIVDVKKVPERGVEFCKSLACSSVTITGPVAVLVAAALVLAFVLASLNGLRPSH